MNIAGVRAFLRLAARPDAPCGAGILPAHAGGTPAPQWRATLRHPEKRSDIWSKAARSFAVGLVLWAAVLAIGCKREAGADADAASASGGTDPAHAAAAATNRIDIPEPVRQNLGITFAKVERRRVAATLRVPGRFELLPSSKREHRTMLPARVELLVRQYDRVEAGQVLARLDSPDWRRMQHEAVEAEGEIKVAEANIDVAEATVAENERAVELLRQRAAALAAANVTRAELNAELSLAQGKSARLAAEARAAQVKLSEAKEHYASKLRTLESVVGMPVSELTRPAGAAAAEPAARPVTAPSTAPAGEPSTQQALENAIAATTAPASRPEAEPLWKAIDAIEIRAGQAGVVESVAITNGGWAEAAGLIMTVVDPQAVRFRASALQADLARLRDGAAASIVAPRGAAAGAADGIPAKFAFGLEASADARTLELLLTPERLAPWVRAGVSAFAEVVTDGSDAPETAIPVAAVVQDELAKVYFRRDPKNPDKAIRVEGDFGVSDGRWVVVNSGLKAGDEVVVDGVFELKLAGGGKAGATGGGHFHADGTWHAAGTPEPGAKK